MPKSGVKGRFPGKYPFGHLLALFSSSHKRPEFQMENKGDLLEVSGRRAAEELARSLEKNDIIKVKGDSIKWKR